MFKKSPRVTTVEMVENASHRRGSGRRRATDWEAVERLAVAGEDYPKTSSSSLGALHDIRYYQALLQKDVNFTGNDTCDVFERVDGHSRWFRGLAGKEAVGRCQKHSSNGSFRAIFCTLERAPGTSFGCRVSLSRTTVSSLSKTLDTNPQFLTMLLGEPEYWAPGDFATYDHDGKLQRIDFFCQHPRWNVHKKDVPLSIYMTHHMATQATTYIISCSSEQAQLKVVQERLEDAFQAKSMAGAEDPFMLHALVTHEVFAEARSVVTPVRHQLYDQLDKVDKYAERSAQSRHIVQSNDSLPEPTTAAQVDEQENLHDITIQLNVVSQEVDSMTASADMASMIVHRLIEGHHRYQLDTSTAIMRNAITKTQDSLHYLAHSIDAQKRWLESYKARKDIAMNLVYNLVMQQNSATSTTIAMETRADGASMKVIAALTMLFLPGTFLSSVFGMSMLNNAKWWLYLALTLPLTIFVIGIWWLWFEFPTVVATMRGWVGSRHKKREEEPCSV